MISQWWSFTLVAIGVTGLVFVYKSPRRTGPIIGIAAQFLWIAYAIVSMQWWFLISAFAYGGANVYGLYKRKLEPDLPEEEQLDELAVLLQERGDCLDISDCVDLARALIEAGYRKQ